MPPFTLLDHLPLAPLAADELERSALVARALADFLARARRLPTFATTHHVHRASWRAPQPLALVRTLRALHGKLVVVNEGRPACLPRPVAAAIRGIVRDGITVLDRTADQPKALVGEALVGIDTRARAEARHARALLGEFPHAAAMLHAAPRPCAVALYEPASIAIERWAGTHAVGAVAESFSAEVSYRLVLVVAARGDDAAPARLRAWLDAPDTREAIANAPAWTWTRDGAPAPWFVTDVLLPDDDALRQMTADAAAAYTQATGRQHAGAVDRYWHLPAWERFEEHGRVVGYVTPSQVTGGGVRASAPGGAPELSAFTSAPAPRLTPAHDRGALVPPGYCLVRCVGTLRVSVLRAPH